MEQGGACRACKTQCDQLWRRGFLRYPRRTLYVTSTPQYEHPQGWHLYLHPVFLPHWHAHDHVAVSLHVSLPAEAHDGTPHDVEGTGRRGLSGWDCRWALSSPRALGIALLGPLKREAETMSSGSWWSCSNTRLGATG